MLKEYEKIENLAFELLQKSIETTDNQKESLLYLILSGYLILAVKSVKKASKQTIEQLLRQAGEIASLMK